MNSGEADGPRSEGLFVALRLWWGRLWLEMVCLSVRKAAARAERWRCMKPGAGPGVDDAVGMPGVLGRVVSSGFMRRRLAGVMSRNGSSTA